MLRGERIVIPLKAGHNWPASETPFKWRFAGWPIMANVEWWLGSFVIFQGIRTNPIALLSFFFLVGGGAGGRRPESPVSLPLDPGMTDVKVDPNLHRERN